MRSYKFKIIFVVVAVFFGVLFFAKASQAATYYVKNGGNDNLDGLSDATAWATIAKVQATVVAGDTVYFRSQDTWTGADTLLTCSTAGIDDSHRTTYDGSTYGSGTRATLRATSRTNSDGMVQIRVSNVTFQGFKVDGNGLSLGGIAIGYTNPMPSGDISNITVNNCEVTNGITTDNPNPSYYYGIHVSMSGSSSQTASNLTITNNIVHDTGHEGISIYPQTSSGSHLDTVLVRGNTVYNTGLVGVRGNGIDIANYAHNVTIEFNYVHDTGGITLVNYGYIEGLTPDNYIIRYNLLKASGFSLSGYFSYPHFKGYGAFYGNIIIDGMIQFGGVDFHSLPNKIYNNTIYNPTLYAYGVYVTASITNAENVEFKNNIIYSGDSSLWPIKDEGGLTNHSNNLLYNTSGRPQLVTTLTHEYTSSDIATWESTVKNSDPTFTGGTLPTGFSGTYGTNMVPNTNYFAITSGAAIDNGVTLGSPYNGSINGAGLAIPILRPQGVGYDIGAYEYVGAPPSDTTPPSPPQNVSVI